MAPTPTKMIEHFPLNPDANLVLLTALDVTTALDSLTALKDFLAIPYLLKAILEFHTPLTEVMGLRTPLTEVMEFITPLTEVMEFLTLLTEVATVVQADLEDQVTAPPPRPMLSEAPSDQSITIDCSTTKSPSRRSTPTPEATAEIDGA